MDHQPLAVLLRRTRQGAGISIRDVSVLLGVSAQTVFNWEHGLATPYPRHARRIAEVIDLLDRSRL